jgi:branched-chain amino acid transport system substrate-binding protein
MTREEFLAGAVAQIFPLPTPLNAQPIQPTGPPMWIGLVAPLSGDQGVAGTQLVNGGLQAIYDANQLRLPTEPLYSLRTFDDRGSLGGAQLSAQFAISDPTIVAVVGHLGGVVTESVVTKYGDALVPLIVPASTYDPITSHGYRTVFRLPTKDSFEGTLYARDLNQRARPKNVVVFAQDGDYGPAVANGFAAQMQADKVPAQVIGVTTVRPDYRTALARALAAAPDFVFFAGRVATLGALLAQLRAGGYTGPFGASQGFFDPATLASNGKAAEGIIVSSSMPPLAFVPAAYTPKANFEQQYGPMTPVSAFGYAAVQLVVSTVRKTGSTNRLSLARALLAPTPTTTCVGEFTFGPTGDPLDPDVYFYTAHEGGWEYAHPAHSAPFLLR